MKFVDDDDDDEDGRKIKQAIMWII